MVTLTAPALEVLLPVPPSLNNAFKNLPNGRGRALTGEARDYKASAGLIIRAAAARSGFFVPFKARLTLTARFYFARDNRDGDNALKLPQDAAAEALGFNDRWIKEWHLYSAVDKRRPRCELRIAIQT